MRAARTPHLWQIAACAALSWARLGVAQTVPAFPGAEGAGAFAKGGRGGDVYHVTNTNASGPGSLGYGLTTGVPAAGRTIVFDVSGYTTLSSLLRVTASKITIAGQTAPGDGFGIKGNTFRISGDDIVIRHMRFRSGHTADAINLDSGSLNSILDHCDAMFSGDENFSSFNSPPENVTFQWSLNAWGRESHSCGGLWDANHATCHHSLWAHNHTRNPKARPVALDWTNNVTYDWDIGFIMGDSETPADWNANVRGNYFICPPGNIRTRALEKANLDRNGRPNFSIYVADNLFDKDGDAVLDGTDPGYGLASGSYTTLGAPVANNGVPVTLDPPLTAYKKIVSSAGPLRLEADASRPLRDEAAARLIQNLTTLSRHHISSVSQTGASNGGFGTLLSAQAPADTDRDGMPDFWETALGFNAGVDDHNATFASSGGVITAPTFFPASTPAGYTCLEEYLHFLAIPHATVAKNTAGAPTFLDVDLRRFTSGFAVAPVFTITNISGGAVTVNGAIARFTPTLNFVGRARFDFLVRDADGSEWKQTFAVLVTASGVPRDLLWVGDPSTNAWDTTSVNWRTKGAASVFSSGDTVLFSDQGSATPAVRLDTTVLAGGMTVDSTWNYATTGTGGITSSGPLVKRGTGALTLGNSGANGFSSVTLDAGTLTLPATSAAGTGTLTLNGGTLNLSPAANSTVPNALAITGDAVVNVTTQHNIGGPWTGAGTLNVNATALWTPTGSMSGFAGRVNLGGASNVRFSGSAFGSAGATWDLGTGSARLTNRNGGATWELGALAGGTDTQVLGAGSVNAESTYNIGANGNDTTFAGSIRNGTFTGTPKTHAVKLGPGALTLAGTNLYTGATTVQGGTLIVKGTLANTPVTVASGATLAGGGAIGGPVTAASGSFISPGTVPFTGETLNVGAGLSLSNPTLFFDLRSSPTGANDRIVMAGGVLAFTGTQKFQFLLLDGTLSPGTWDLITGADSSSSSAANLLHNLPAGTRQTFALTRPPAGPTPGFVKLTVTGNSATLIWTGAASAVWDAAAANWSGANGPPTFVPNDAVIFDDSSAVNAITIPGAVAPRSILVSNTSRAYTLGGVDPAVAAIIGGASLAKSGTGALSLTGTNSHTGGTTIENGATLSLANDHANAGGLGTGLVTLRGGTLRMFSNLSTFNAATHHLVVPAGQIGTLHADARCDLYGSLAGGGTLNMQIPWVRTTLFSDWSAFTGTINVTTDGNTEPGGGASTSGDFRMGTSYAFPGFPLATVALGDKVIASYTGILDAGAGTTIKIGELSGTASSSLRGGETGGRNFIYHIGGKTLAGIEVTHAGSIAEQNAGTATTLVKTGAGIWKLAGTCAYNGGTTVEEGTLRVSGTLESRGGNFRVLDGATLDLLGGTLTTPDLQIALNGRLTGRGTIAGDLTNDGTVTCGAGALTVTGEVINNGTMRFTGGAALQATGSFVNNGVLDLLTGERGLPANLENNGVIIDSSSLGQVKVTRAGATVTVAVQTYAGHAYQLQRAGSLAGPGWTDVGSSQTGDGNVRNFVDGGASGQKGFYRVVVTP